jgi:hypothetical protein
MLTMKVSSRSLMQKLLESSASVDRVSILSWKCGRTKDEKDLRGRWKKGRVSDVYDESELPFPDAKVAGKLCIGGPCKYIIVDGSGVTADFLLEHVVPSIRTRFTFVELLLFSL